MKNYSLIHRADLYRKAFPKYKPLRVDERWMDGIWFMGNQYKGSGYYGSYPPGYLKRIMSMFPDAEKILHLFSGSLPSCKEYFTFDINDNLEADVIGDAHSLSHYFDLRKKFDLVLADPPYSEEDSLHYGVPMLNRNQVLKECCKIIKKGGFLLWMDQILPMYRKTDWTHCIAIGIVRSTNHRFRLVSGFRRN